MTGLLGNVTDTLDNTLTGGDKENGQGGLLGSTTGAVGKTVDGVGNLAGETTNGVGNTVGQTTNGVGNAVGETTKGVGNVAVGATNTASGLAGGQQQQHLLRRVRKRCRERPLESPRHPESWWRKSPNF